MNQRFIAPAYDVAANLTAFGCAVAASSLLGHWVPAMLSAFAILCCAGSSSRGGPSLIAAGTIRKATANRARRPADIAECDRNAMASTRPWCAGAAEIPEHPPRMRRIHAS